MDITWGARAKYGIGSQAVPNGVDLEPNEASWDQIWGRNRSDLELN